MKYMFFIRGAVLMVLLMILSGMSFADNYSYTVDGVSFKLNLKFSSPIKAGMDAFSLSFPDSPGTGSEKYEITLAFLRKDMIESLNMTEYEQYMYAKSIYFGTSDEAQKKVEKTFLGKKISGEFIECTIPRESTLEIYLIPLSNGDKLAAGFRRFDPALEDADKVIDTFADTFTENHK